ncbi:MAG: hypothetical protein KTR17_09285 [Cellvibrionaceae bacterium]|nr:hypothetical protein [Cellvibrionaceae bacterium]
MDRHDDIEDRILRQRIRSLRIRFGVAAKAPCVRQETLDRLLSISDPVATIPDPYAEGEIGYLVIAIDSTAPIIREVPANTAGAYKTLADAKEAARQILQTAIAQAKESLTQLRQVGIDNINYISL